jgi:hypothetical protein
MVMENDMPQDYVKVSCDFVMLLGLTSVSGRQRSVNDTAQ